MRISPEWFIDERSLEMVELYLFNRQNPSQALPGGFSGQPVIWIESKLILDGVLGTGIL
jgi:hypothetical protein